AVVQLDEVAREGKTEARAASARAPSLLGLIELVEDPLHLLGGDADALIGESLFGTKRQLIATMPPCGENFTAFESRLNRICLSRPSSSRTSGTFGSV